MPDEAAIQEARAHLSAGRGIEAMVTLMEQWRAAPGDEILRIELARVAREIKSLRHKQVLYQDIGAGDPRFGKAVDDRYLIIQRISESPGVSLYRAHDEKDPREVCLWYLEPLWRSSELRQGWVLGKLGEIHPFQHASAARLLGFGAPSDDEAYAILERVDGPNLAHRLAAAGPLPLDAAVEAIGSLLDVLSAAHEKGIFHGNLRADHIVMRGSGIRILDLGLYPLIRQLYRARKVTRTGVVPGLLTHLPPEFEGSGDVDARWDVCSAGSLAFEVLTGEPPYGYPEPQKVRSYTMKMKEPAIPKARDREKGHSLPEWVDGILAKMLARNPADRYATAAEALQAWRSAGG